MNVLLTICRNVVIYSDFIKKLLNTDIETLNFADDVDQCIKHINKFVAETTRNQINDFATKGQIDTDTEFAMINAIYFKGQWASPFDKSLTERKIFYNQDGDAVYVDMMFKWTAFEIDFISNLNTNILKLPYAGDGLTAMYIFLPANTPTAIDELLDNLSPEILNNVITDDLYAERVSVNLPKFSFEKDFDLVPGLQRMGVQNLFNNPDLSGIFESTNALKTKMMHKAKIEINEDGSMATAATMLYTHLSAERNEFNCNHPFMFVIHDQTLNEVLFAGIYRGPKNIPPISNAAYSSNKKSQKGHAFLCLIFLAQSSLLSLLFVGFPSLQ